MDADGRVAATVATREPSDPDRDLWWAHTGGGAFAGTFINHPDTDLTDPVLNTSGVPWHRLYYQDNYPRLQRIKTRWDPRDVFRHSLSVRPG